MTSYRRNTLDIISIVQIVVMPCIEPHHSGVDDRCEHSSFTTEVFSESSSSTPSLTQQDERNDSVVNACSVQKRAKYEV